MKRLNLPSKYRNHGLHIWCITCKKAVTSDPCSHAEQQRFQSRVYNPITKRQDCIKSYDTRDSEEAFSSHLAYRGELKRSNYNVVQPAIQVGSPPIIFLREASAKYITYLQDIGVPDYEKRNLTREYIHDQRRYVLRFLQTLYKEDGKISNLPMTAISDKHVAAFDEYVRGLNLSQTSYNAHIKAVKYFIDYVIKELRVDMKNPFERVKIREIHYDPEIIPSEEFEQLLKVITPENGIGTKGKKREEHVNYYRDWLKKVLIFALLTGERLDGIVLLKWKHIEGNFLKIPNWKVNRIQKSEDYYSYTPVTADLAELLVGFKIGDPEEYIVVSDQQNRATLKKFISKAFTHYWRVSGINRKVSFKNLRKTYITQLTSLIGEKALFVKHSGDKTAIKHYLNKKELLDKMQDVRLYDISGWL